MHINYLQDRQQLGFAAIKDLDSTEELAALRQKLLKLAFASILWVKLRNSIPTSSEELSPSIKQVIVIKSGGEIATKTKTDEHYDQLKKKYGKTSIFVQALQCQSYIRNPKSYRKNLSGFNFFDSTEKKIVKPSVILNAHFNCAEEFEKLPREIVKNDRTIKFDKKYSGIFKNNYQVFGYNLYIEENLAKDASNNKIKKAKQNLFEKYGEVSENYLRTNLFENPCIIKYQECRYLDISHFVTIYYDQFTDLFAIVDSKSNCLLDFGIATEVRYAEIFSYKSALTDKAKDVCIAPIKRPLEKFDFGKSKKSKDLEESECLGESLKSLSWDDAMAILEARYGSNYIAINNGELKIQDWQAAKKVNHAVCFGINPSDYGISQKQLLEINKKGGIVTYLQRGNKLPSLDLIRAYQNAIKTFCEDPNLSVRNDESTFGGI